jgi:mannose-1-phosphate guanylyltransferase
MKAFVLAAGFGTRLLPLTGTLPKPLIPVLNVPSLCYTLFLLKEAGIREVVCNIHHHPDSVRQFVAQHDFGDLDILLSEEKTILGTGGGLKNCEKLLDKDHFLLINSDIISDIDLKVLMARHRESGLGGTLALYETPLAQQIGHIGIRNGRVQDFRNTRHTGLLSDFIYTGTAVFSPSIFRYLRSDYSGIVDTGFYGLVDHEGLGFHAHKGFWQDIGTLKSFYRANLDDNFRILQLEERMNRHLGMTPRMISEEASISPDASVVNSVISSGCAVESGSVIEHSVIMPGTAVRKGTVIRNTIACACGIIPQ